MAIAPRGLKGGGAALPRTGASASARPQPSPPAAAMPAIADICRYPVKGLSAEHLPKTRFLMLMRNERLAALETGYDGGSEVLSAAVTTAGEIAVGASLDLA